MKQEMIGWQCHQLDYMQIICTSLQMDALPDAAATLKAVGMGLKNC